MRMVGNLLLMEWRLKLIKLNNALSPAELEKALFEIGAKKYHNLHVFHKLLHSGSLNKGQVQAWALNRYCYQAAIPRKDAALISKIHDKNLRKEWTQRILDHDGRDSEEGGIERWLVLTDGLGLDRDYVISLEGVLPATVFAVEAYVRFVAENPPVVAVASCLTELFAPAIHQERIVGMLENYSFIDEKVLAYFRRRLTQAPRDAHFALSYVKEHATSIQDQEGVLNALDFKCNVLWAQLDALYAAYVQPGCIPPGAFSPERGL